MIKRKRKLTILTVIALTILVSAPGLPTDLDHFIWLGDRSLHEARFENQTKKQVQKAIHYYREALKLAPENSYLLNSLSASYFILGEAFLNDQEEKMKAYEQGLNYGLRSLRLNRKFDQAYQRRGLSCVRETAKSLKDIHALFWTASNLGRLDEYRGVLNALGDLSKLLAIYKRALELDETYMGGGPHRGLGVINAELASKWPFTIYQLHKYNLGWEEAKYHFQKAIQIDPACLSNYLLYAKYYALKKGNKELLAKLLGRIEKAPIGGRYPLFNELAKQEAKELKKITEISE